MSESIWLWDKYGNRFEFYRPREAQWWVDAGLLFTEPPANPEPPPVLWLWKIEDPEGKHYDAYDAAIVVAVTEDDARKIHPAGDISGMHPMYGRYTWGVAPEEVKVTKIGIAASGLKAGDVVLASYYSA